MLNNSNSILIKCTHKTRNGNGEWSESLSNVTESLDEIIIKKMHKMITQIKTLKQIDPTKRKACDNAVVIIEKDLVAFQHTRVKRTITIDTSLYFEYHLNRKINRAHFFKASNKRSYQSIRDYCSDEC